MTETRFELLAMPHLDAAFNLARWLDRQPDDAEDVVQDAYLRAFRYFRFLSRRQFPPVAPDHRAQQLLDFGATASIWTNELCRRTADGRRRRSLEPLWSIPARDPEALLLHGADSERVNALMQELPPDYREVLLLREVEELSYRQIAEACRSGR